MAHEEDEDNYEDFPHSSRSITCMELLPLRQFEPTSIKLNLARTQPKLSGWSSRLR